uniref:Uncharacterized protein n=1 Tax=Setaria viridis TaxID=4556 RepID=A0A4U6W778_SETVI|nr:hypothetical protein SEVIR_1G120400v2 [Setaria viridis]
MDPPDRSFSRLLGSDPINPRPENTSFQYIPNFTPNHISNSFNHSQFPPTSFNHAHYPQNCPPTHGLQNFNPFGPPGNFQQYAQYPPKYLGFQQQAQFVHSGGIFGSPAGASSHGSNSTTPQSQRREVEQAEEVKDSNGSSLDEGRRGVRINYTEEENLQLASAWLKHSVDPGNGNDKTGESYWRSVAEEFNSNKLLLPSLMDFCSGESYDMLMEKARIMFRRENKQRPFTLEYVWKVLKDQPKWKISVMDREHKNKRTKVDGFGAYTSSSNQDTNDGERHKEKHREGQKKTKAWMRGKGKEKSRSTGKKTVEAAAAKVKFDKMSKYLEYADKDTSNYSVARLKMHNQILAELSKDLYPPSDD